MQILGMVLWFLLLWLFAWIINYLAKRPLMNPWLWFGASYVVLYVVGLIFGLATSAPNFSYFAGYYFVPTAIAAVVGFFGSRKWRADHQGPSSGGAPDAHLP